MVEIQFLSAIPVRQAWPREDKDFTPWLASQDLIPLTHLLSTCGIDIGSEPEVRTEVKIPGLLRSLDILVQLENDERIAIENQFSEVDHDHLTRALAYAVGLEATTVILVAESHRPEFVAVARYLNSAGLAYEEHGIRVLLVRLAVESLPGSSVIHPVFEVVAAPDEWKAAVDDVTKGQFSERDTAIYAFHEELLPLLKEATGSFRNVSPSANSWKSGSVGIGGVSITYGPRRTSTYVQVWFSRANAPEVNHAGLAALETHRSELEAELQGYELDWRRNDATGILEVIVDDIGYETDPAKGRLEEVASVAAKMAKIVRQHQTEISSALTMAAVSASAEAETEGE